MLGCQQRCLRWVFVCSVPFPGSHAHTCTSGHCGSPLAGAKHSFPSLPAPCGECVRRSRSYTLFLRLTYTAQSPTIEDWRPHVSALAPQAKMCKNLFLKVCFLDVRVAKCLEGLKAGARMSVLIGGWMRHWVVRVSLRATKLSVHRGKQCLHDGFDVAGCAGERARIHRGAHTTQDRKKSVLLLVVALAETNVDMRVIQVCTWVKERVGV
jgi:hypothetical protein